MIFAVLIVGVLILSAALHDTQHELAAALERDVLGSQGFLAWLAAIGAIGAIGYVPGMQRFSRSLLLLLAVVAVLANRGIFANATAALQAASSSGPAPSVPGQATLGSSQGSAPAQVGASGQSSAGSAVAALGPLAALALL